MSDAVIKRTDGLAGERAAGSIGDRDGDHYRQAVAEFIEEIFEGEEGGLGVERI